MRYLLPLAATLWALPATAQDTGQAAHDHHGAHDMAGMSKQKEESDNAHAAHGTAQERDAMQGMDPPASPVMDHSGHAMPMNAQAPVPQAPPPPAALSGPVHAADEYYADGAMAHAREMMTAEMDDFEAAFFMLDRLEWQPGKGQDGFAWEASMSVGGDIDRFWITTEGDGEFGDGLDDAEVQALWSHAVGPWFDLHAGVRQQIFPGPDRTQLAIGLEGLAPYMIEVSATAFVSTKGELTGRIEAETDQRLTQRLILQPRVEANFSAQDIPEIRLGSGITSLEAGVRLRYEMRRTFAPYVGFEWQKQFGRTATLATATGDNPDRVVGVIGLRAWF
ncbi:hypothetical protein B2G71_04615 [Novosphingobium sp. PC22D]|uniref:copper resistance protein B n=1 Tax=Novosphingobium sp. PC22D TaxID=1962403 RepID=UPI000BF1D01A|nr:copper resistance protein B [Novosphingobium sp. PC22D]PEQ13615.1 hypothetical protein B2G71_04615 [Novosphingobium sp. PC22D]